MAKLTADEFIKKWTVDKKVSEDDDVLIELMEDATDSIVVSDSESEEITKLKADNEKLAADYADLKERYKMRFLTSESEEKIEEKEEQAESIICKTTGTVESMVVRQGTPMVKVGDEVAAGDLLVEGFYRIKNDAGEIVRYEGVAADADIYILKEDVK